MTKSLGNFVYDYWFDKISLNQDYIDSRLPLWFYKDPEKDLQTKELFLNRLSNFSICATTSAKEALGQIVLLDQIPRNIYRGTPKAFSYDNEALAYTKKCLELNMDENLEDIEKFFFYLPFEHAEDLFCQEESLRLIVPLKNTCPPSFKKFFAFAEDFAIRHYEAIKKFGRFPHRNKILRRESSKDELIFLNDERNIF